MKTCVIIAFLALSAAQMPIAQAQTVTLRCDPTNDQDGPSPLVVTIDRSQNTVHTGENANDGWYVNQKSWTQTATDSGSTLPASQDGHTCTYHFTQFVQIGTDTVFFGEDKQLVPPCAYATGLLAQDIKYSSSIDRLTGAASFGGADENDTYNDGSNPSPGSTTPDFVPVMGGLWQCQVLNGRLF
jgi:hypothetical protein